MSSETFETRFEITDEQVQAQLKWESECAEAGYNYCKDSAQHMLTSGQAASTGAGITLISRNIIAVAEHLKTWLKEMETKPGRKSLAAICLSRIDPLKVAAIGLRELVNHIGGDHTLTAVASGVASSILLEIHCGQFADQNKALFEQIERDLKQDPQGKMRHVRRRKIKGAIERYGISVETMANREKVLVGSRLIEIIAEVTGLFEISMHRCGTQTPLYVIPSPEIREWMDTHIEQSSILSPMYLPTLIPPKPWTTTSSGGYYSRRLSLFLVTLRGTWAEHKLRMQEMDQFDLSTVYKAINGLQNVAWKVNARVLDVALEVWEKGIVVNSMPCRMNNEVGPKPDFEKNPTGWATWKRQATATFIQNREWASKRNSAERTLMIATRMRGVDQMYMPYLLDFRGRIYAKPQFLNPQGSKLAKGLLTFATGKPLGERGVFWLAVHTANCFGYDKASLEDRVKWVKDNERMILDCACEPIEFQEWTKADSPWEFLAACMEWSNYLTHGEGYICALPISVDGKCNGLAHWTRQMALNAADEAAKAREKADDKAMKDHIQVSIRGTWGIGHKASASAPVKREPPGLRGRRLGLPGRIRRAA